MVNGRSNKKRPGAGDDPDGGFFMDPPPAAVAEKPAPQMAARASERRRQRGEEPSPAGPPDTRAMSRDMSPQVQVRGVISCVRGPESGVSFQLIDGNITIGRARENQLVLKDLACSRRHIRIESSAAGCRLVDLGSGNGTRVNGVSHSDALLRHGDNIEIGASVLVFTGPDQADAAAGLEVPRARLRADHTKEELERQGPTPDDASVVHRARTRQVKSADVEAVAAQLASMRATPGSPGSIRGPTPGGGRDIDQLWHESDSQSLAEVQVGSERLQASARPRVPPPPPATLPPMENRRRPPPPPTFDIPDPASFMPAPTPPGPRWGVWVAILGGVALLLMLTAGAAWWQSTKQAEEASYDAAIAAAEKAYAASDWNGALLAGNRALLLRSSSALARSYVDTARKHLDDAKLAPPSPPPPSLPPTVAPMAPVPVAPVVPVPVVPVPVVPVPMVTPPAPPTPAPVNKSSSRRRSQPRAPTSVEVEEPEEPAPQESRKPLRGKSMSDEDAGALFKQAIDQLRSGDDDSGCSSLQRVSQRAPSDSRWKEKAQALFDKRCEE